MEKRTALQWGMVGFESAEQARPAFEGTTLISPVDGQPTLYFSRRERSIRSFKSNVAIFGGILIVIGTVAFVFFIRAIISASNLQYSGIQTAVVLSSLLLAVQIQLMNDVYGSWAIKLNDYENHRTDTEYEDALIAKTFLFQFVNSYAALFYIAFVKPFIPLIDPCLGSCMKELQASLGTIFLTRLVLGNLLELGRPFILSFFKNRQVERIIRSARPVNLTTPHPSTRRASRRSTAAVSITGIYKELEGVGSSPAASNDDHKYDISEVERAFMLSEYDVMMGTFDDYAEMVIQFGYATMFVTAFPLATTMALVNNYVELRVDAWKLCQLTRRPEPRSQEDIGTWLNIMEIIATFSVFVNAGIVAFSGTFAINSTWTERIWIFMGMSSALFCIKIFVAFVIPDVPLDVEIQLARQDYIKDKIINNVPDDDDSELVKSVRIVPRVVVLSGDDDPL